MKTKIGNCSSAIVKHQAELIQHIKVLNLCIMTCWLELAYFIYLCKLAALNKMIIKIITLNR